MAILLSTLLNGVEYRLIKGSLSSRVVSIENDSRKVGAGSLFVAIIGAKCDGHDYIYRACETGASCVVVDLFLWQNSKQSLFKLSSRYRNEELKVKVAFTLKAQLPKIHF